MKYWNTKHWENWEAIVDCLSRVSAQAPPADEKVEQEPIQSGAALSADLGAVGADESDIADLEVSIPSYDEAAHEPSEVDLPEETEVQNSIIEESSVSDQVDAPVADEHDETKDQEIDTAGSQNPIGKIFGDAPDRQPVDASDSDEDASEAEVAQQVPGHDSVNSSADITESAARFFGGIPWSTGGSSDQEAKLANQNPSTLGSNGHSRTTVKSPGSSKVKETDKATLYFMAIPWLGLPEDTELEDDSEIERISIRSAADDSGLDVRDADLTGVNLLTAGMRSAAKTSDRMAGSRKENLSFKLKSDRVFKSIPW